MGWETMNTTVTPGPEIAEWEIGTGTNLTALAAKAIVIAAGVTAPDLVNTFSILQRQTMQYNFVP